MISYVDVIVGLTRAAMDMKFRDTSGEIIRETERERHGGDAIANPLSTPHAATLPRGLDEARAYRVRTSVFNLKGFVK